MRSYFFDGAQKKHTSYWTPFVVPAVQGWAITVPGFPPKKGSTIQGDYVSVYGNARSKKDKTKKTYKGYEKGKITVLQSWHNAMGIDWKMTNKELSQNIPPKYTEYIGERVLEILNLNH